MSKLKSVSKEIDLPYDGGEFELEEKSAFDGAAKTFACEGDGGMVKVPVSFSGKKAEVGKIHGKGKLRLLFWY